MVNYVKSAALAKRLIEANGRDAPNFGGSRRTLAWT
jgi:hypothetical protein